MRKKHLYYLVLLLLFTLANGLLAQKSALSGGKKQPNILFLLTDDQSFNTINALGNKEVYTPNMDRLVNEGTAFTHAHIMGGNTGAICMPSRAMLMTSNFINKLDYSSKGAIADIEVTLPQALKNSGYETFGTGKWHNGAASFAKSFTDGENIFIGGMSNHLKVPVHDFDETGKYKKGDATTSSVFSSVLFADAAVHKLESYNKEKPFFMYVAFSSPHDPRMAPEEYAKNEDELNKKREFWS